jgi:hypothetical protein
MKSILNFIFAILCPLIVGCSIHNLGNSALAKQVDVFGAIPFSNIDFTEITGVKAVEEPCIRGYDRIFDALDITIGYGFNKRIRKIVTLNPATSMFGVNIGMTIDESKERLHKAGFIEDSKPSTFRNDNYSLTLLIRSKDGVSGLRLEIIE